MDKQANDISEFIQNHKILSAAAAISGKILTFYIQYTNRISLQISNSDSIITFMFYLDCILK